MAFRNEQGVFELTTMDGVIISKPARPEKQSFTLTPETSKIVLVLRSVANSKTSTPVPACLTWRDGGGSINGFSFPFPLCPVRQLSFCNGVEIVGTAELIH